MKISSVSKGGLGYNRMKKRNEERRNNVPDKKKVNNEKTKKDSQ